MFRIPTRYDLSNPKAAENAIVADALSGRAKYIKWVTHGMMSTDHHARNILGRVKVRVDDACIGGSFTFVYVNGVDMSYGSVKDFDYHRVATAILQGIDRPTKSPSLWNC